MKKKLFALLLVLALAIVLLPNLAMSASAEEATVGDWTYTITNGVAVPTRYNGTAAKVTLPTSVTIDGTRYKLTTLGAYAFNGNVKLQSVVIPKEYTKLGNGAFKNCTSLASVTINGDLADASENSLGLNSWNHCRDYSVFYNAGTNVDKMTVTFGKGVTYVPAYFFATGEDKGNNTYCHVTDLVLSETVETIGLRAFQNCYDLKNITFAAKGKLSEIGSYAFCNCTGLKTVKLPNSVTTIYDRAFLSCTNLKSVTLSNKLAKINGYAFENCYALSSIVLPKSLTSLGNAAFKNCTNLASVTINSDLANASENSIGLNSWNHCSDYSVFYNAGTNVDKMTITFNEGATYVPAYLFATGEDKGNNTYCHVTDLVLSKTVASIGLRAFQNCYDLKNITFAAKGKLSEIGSYAFCNCTGLKTVKLPNSVTTIYDRAFLSCTNLKSVTLSNKLAKIEGYAFENCYALSSIVLPKSLTSLGNCAFKNCTNLASVTINSNLANASENSIGLNSWNHCRDYSVFYNTGINADKMTITFNEGVTYVPAYLFATGEEKGNNTYCSVDEISLPLTLKEIRVNAFKNCYDLNHVIYAGTKKAWSALSFNIADGNDPLATAKFTYLKKEPPKPAVTFKDVPANAYFAEAVKWAVKNGITSGTSKTTFSPNDGCTRAQVVTFLWRSAGSPKPKTSNNPFKDVKSDGYYYEAVLWAVENRITEGTSRTTFSPNATCTRGQIVTFLWRAKQSHTPKTKNNPFQDVQTRDYFYKAVLWAVENGITQGTSKTKFSPNDTCTRGQIVTFLYRAYKKN